MTQEIKIEWLYDEHDCETCGSSYAEGAKVHINGELVIENIPYAHCYGGENWDRDDIYKRIFLELGYHVTES